MYVVLTEKFEEFVEKIELSSSVGPRKSVLVVLEGYLRLLDNQEIISCMMYGLPTSWYDNTSIKFHAYYDYSEENLKKLIKKIKTEIDDKKTEIVFKYKIFPLKKTYLP